ncbi:MAG: ribose-phosphate diphosphokinase [Clostridiales bacterium]|jgi:ribose-phosphate pyrophosphokinase|nr:ribose-phosphate diphosphokinase [Clostridiales bacterium]
MQERNGTIKIFAGSSGVRFAQRMCAYLEIEIGKTFYKKFSDGNIYVRVEESIRDKDVYIVQPIAKNPNDEFTELLFWIDAFRRASANSVTAIIPYFGYAKGDKKDEPRVSIRARVCADCIERVGADRVVTMDLHSAQVQGFFSKPMDHLYAQSLLCEYARKMGIVDDDLVVVSPDAGFAKNARMFANELKRPVAIGDKVRTDHNEKAKVLDIIGEVRGKNCIIVDDFTISGGTLIDVAHGLKDKGAKDVYAFLSHCVLDAKGVKKIEDSPIKLLVSTDTVTCPEAEQSEQIRIISAAPLFAQAIKLIHDRHSISEIFSGTDDRLLRMSFKPDTLDIEFKTLGL